MFMTMRWLSGIIWGIVYPLLYRSVLGGISLLPQSHPWKSWKSKRLSSLPTPSSQKSILFFCPSLGEYQGINHLISALKSRAPHLQIEVTFFSPSGYEALNQMKHEADVISYSPLDTAKACRAFLEARQISHVVISTLALWPRFLKELSSHHIPFTFVNASCKHALSSRLYYHLFASIMDSADHIYCRNEFTRSYLDNLLSHAEVVHGDPGALCCS